MSRRSSRLVLVGFVLLVLGLTGWMISGQIQAWRALRAGRHALERNLPAQAREHFARCLQSWPNSAEVHFLAGSAARRAGELAQARRHLDRAAELGWVKEALDLERALWRAQAGELAESERYLHACLDNDHPDSLRILEVLTPAYLRNYQLDQARACLKLWLELAPADAHAWYLQGVLCEREANNREARISYEEAVRLDPARDNARHALVRVLLDSNLPRDAEPHLDVLAKSTPLHEEIRFLQARCAFLLGRNEQAIALLDPLLRQSPNHVKALALRGRIELDSGRPHQAVPYLNRAAEQPSADSDVLYTWLRCLRQIGNTEEAQAGEKRLKQMQQDLDRMAKLIKEIVQHPDQFHLRREAGELCLRNRQEEQGLRWLESVLRQKPDDAPTHRLLADYYSKKGQPTLASRHRQLAEQPSLRPQPAPGPSGR